MFLKGWWRECRHQFHWPGQPDPPSSPPTGPDLRKTRARSDDAERRVLALNLEIAVRVRALQDRPRHPQRGET